MTTQCAISTRTDPAQAMNEHAVAPVELGLDERDCGTEMREKVRVLVVVDVDPVCYERLRVRTRVSAC
jgi:hypothetical protein